MFHPEASPCNMVPDAKQDKEEDTRDQPLFEKRLASN
jgi:hypothetical protein